MGDSTSNNQANERQRTPMDPARRRFLQSALGLGLVSIAGAGFAVWRHKTLAPYREPDQRIAPEEAHAELRIPIMGDWGSGTRAQSRVLAAMERVGEHVGGYHAGWLLGDNFYFKGVQSTDDPKWRDYFEEQFDRPHLALLEWNAVLGNHDYMGDAEAQIAYSGHTPDGRPTRWRMPAHFYRKDHFNDYSPTPMLTVLALDTNHEWYEEGDNAKRMLAWLDQQLASLKHVSERVIVVGHHPVVSYSKSAPEPFMVEQVLPRLVEFQPAAYICGHNHCMELIEHQGLTCIVVGCGGKTLYDTGQGRGLIFAKKAHGFGLLRIRQGSFSFEFRDTGGDLVHRYSSHGHRHREARPLHPMIW